MPAPQTAARLEDDITHSDALFGAVEGILVGIAVGALVGAAIVATGGLAVVAVGAVLVGGGIGGMFGKTIGKHSVHSVGKVLTGSANVWIGFDKKPAARTWADVAHCEDHSDSEPAQSPPTVLGKRIAQGSGTVYINGFHAAREGDKGSCDFTLGQGWPTVFIGGPTVTLGTIDPEVPGFVDDIITGMLLVGTALMMWPGAVAMFSAGTAAGLGGGVLGVSANLAQVGVRLAAQVYVGMTLSEAGGAIGHGAAGLLGQQDGSLTSDLMTLGGATVAPFAGGGLYKGIAETPLPGMEAPPIEGVQTGPTGARTSFDGSPEEQARADAAYERIRSDNGDVARIADNTGYPPDQVASVKQHLFYNEHDLPIGDDQTGDLQMSRQQFTPDPVIADRWTKAADGTLGQPGTDQWGNTIPNSADPSEVSDFHDLMAHEYAEQGLMADGLPYRSPDTWQQGSRGWDFYPDAQNAGAHDLSPLATSDGRDPFVHYDALGRSSEGIPRPNADNSNLNDMLAGIRRSLGESGGQEGGPRGGGEPTEPFVPARPLPANPPEGIPVTPAPTAEPPVVANPAEPGAGLDSAPEITEPLPENAPEAARATPEPAPRAKSASSSVAQNNYDKAVTAKGSLPKSFDGKTVLSDKGKNFVSGPGGRTVQRPSGFTQTSVADTRDYGKSIGYEFPTHLFDNGDPGSFYASHADAQALAAGDGETAGITQPICGSCQNLYRASSVSRGEVLTPRDSNGEWSFNPDGTVVRPDGEVVGPNDSIIPRGNPGGKIVRADGSILSQMPPKGSNP